MLKAFRLFVSFAFSDFAQERETIPTLTPSRRQGLPNSTPSIYAGCERGGPARPSSTADMCLREVEAVMRYPPPNLLIMTGDRYGWVQRAAREMWSSCARSTARCVNYPAAANALRSIVTSHGARYERSGHIARCLSSGCRGQGNPGASIGDNS